VRDGLADHMSWLTSVLSLRRTPYVKDTVKGRQRVWRVAPPDPYFVRVS
jgi:hypothetical protein